MGGGSGPRSIYDSPLRGYEFCTFHDRFTDPLEDIENLAVIVFLIGEDRFSLSKVNLDRRRYSGNSAVPRLNPTPRAQGRTA